MKINIKDSPSDGDTRTKKGFLFLPKILEDKNGKMQLRWLLFASWEQRYFADGFGAMGSEWADDKWID